CVEIIIKPSSKMDGALRVEVKDDGVGMSQEDVNNILHSFDKKESLDTKGTGMAIVNCHRRLKFYYNDLILQDMTIVSELGVGTTVSFEIPFNGGDQ
ncbi:sensor histidine kinase, partial [Pseudomonas sp. 2995-3]|uniref:sensor histidine kinase n=1 Tax=Pseudomonas sp. 2995-3 TaxID=1712680 RepID=UPI000C5F2747